MGLGLALPVTAATGISVTTGVAQGVSQPLEICIAIFSESFALCERYDDVLQFVQNC